MKNLLMFIGILALMLVFVPTTRANINPNNFEIIINDGSGKTSDKIVTIKVRHDYSGGTRGYQCLPDKITNDTTTAGLAINNTGQSSYQEVGEGICINGWSNIKWDISGYDGNASYGVKTLYFQLWEQGGGNGYTTRSVLYEKQAESTLDPLYTQQSLTQQPQISQTATTTPKPTTTTKQVTSASSTASPSLAPVASDAPTITSMPTQESINTEVLGVQTTKDKQGNEEAFIATIIVLALALIGMGSFIRKSIINKK